MTEVSIAAINALFSGKKSPFRDIVLLDAAAAFIAGKARSRGEAREPAAISIDSGKAAQTLEKLITRGNA